ncbi:DEAD/DEAH box helicase domain-containing protein [Toxoplasma gondii ME49]|uniref:DEAD/DEAH box helicase domain-containing protein n=1 Tax=Toxoplasma gondii (strain ATCC 50611 / Me49) TaxID=508771 RepID=S8F909_TOXGM|nr:DEAD/DEAH box helicase domain-containing protein [Toxoplasma gondii ME49]EPT30083.1 DEAD/DEAH box helicase domain-containing protein [Toxoplasma gondii ME49]|eukprot:XP_002367666.2 DEAD/DEAH box helicase domain-containing protein [Toxoplasma gondii ME49]
MAAAELSVTPSGKQGGGDANPKKIAVMGIQRQCSSFFISPSLSCSDASRVSPSTLAPPASSAAPQVPISHRSSLFSYPRASDPRAFFRGLCMQCRMPHQLLLATRKRTVRAAQVSIPSLHQPPAVLLLGVSPPSSPRYVSSLSSASSPSSAASPSSSSSSLTSLPFLRHVCLFLRPSTSPSTYLRSSSRRPHLSPSFTGLSSHVAPPCWMPPRLHPRPSPPSVLPTLRPFRSPLSLVSSAVSFQSPACRTLLLAGGFGAVSLSHGLREAARGMATKETRGSPRDAEHGGERRDIGGYFGGFAGTHRGLGFSVPPRPPDPDMTSVSRPSHPTSSSSISVSSSSPSSPSSPSPSSCVSDSSPTFVLRPPTEADFSESEALGLGTAFKPPTALDSFPLPPSSSVPPSHASSVASALPASPASSEPSLAWCSSAGQSLEARFPSFASLDLHPVLVERLKQLGVETPTATQISAFLLIDKGRDCVVVDRTGTGKTLAYLLPFVNKVYKLHDILLLAQVGVGPSSGTQVLAGDEQPGQGEARQARGNTASSPVPFEEEANGCDSSSGERAHRESRESSRVKPKSVGRMLQDQLLRCQEEVIARHAALSPAPQVWESLRAPIPRSPSSASHEANSADLSSAYGDALQAVGISPDSPNPLGALRPAVLLLPTHDMVIDALHTLRRLDVLGRLQIQCLSGVERNVKERTAGARDEEARDLRELRRTFRRRPDGEKLARDARDGAEANEAETGDRGDRGRDVGPEARARPERNGRTREGGARREEPWASAGMGERGDAALERAETDEGRRVRGEEGNGGGDESAVWKGQVLRKPRMTADGMVVTETRPFSEKKIKNIHEVHVRGSERSGVRESWRSQALHGDGAAAESNRPTAPLEADADSRSCEALEEESDDDEHPFEVCSLPVLHKPRIRWGAVDLVISTPHLFLEDLERFRGENLQPSMLILDEADELLRARGSRTLLMDILGYCRPRVPVPAPHTAKRALPDFPPCQVVFSGATLASLGPCSPGVMLIERFGNAFEVSPRSRHQLRDEVKQLWIRLNAERLAELLSLAQPPWRVNEGGEDDEDARPSSQWRTAEGRSLQRGLEAVGEVRGGGRARPRRVRGGLITGSALEEARKKEFVLLGGNLPVYLKRRNQPSDEAVALASRLVAETSADTTVKRKLRQQVSWDHRVDILLALLAAFPVDRTVVFVNSVDRCIRLFDFFRDRGWPVVSFHRKMSMKHRSRALARLLAASSGGDSLQGDSGSEEDGEDQFAAEGSGGGARQSGQGRIEELLPASLMIATDLACRGLDLQGVQHVINFDFPTDAMAYIHRAGRTCRRPSSHMDGTERRSPFCLVSNLVSDDDFPLASSLYFLQKERQNLERTFSRKASFKARYIRHREAEKKRKAGENERRPGEGDAEAEGESAKSKKDAYTDDIEQLWSQMYRMQFERKATGARVRGIRDEDNGLPRMPTEAGGRYAERNGEKDTRGQSADTSSAASASLGRDRWRRLRRMRVEREESKRPERESLSYREAAASRRKQLVDRLLRGAVWSEDGRTACIEAPRSFFDEGESEVGTGEPSEELDGVASSRSDRHLLEPRRRSAGTRGKESDQDRRQGALGQKRKREDSFCSEEGGDAAQEQCCDPVAPTQSERQVHQGGKPRGAGTSRALQMRAALFDDDSEDEDDRLPPWPHSAQQSHSISSPSPSRASVFRRDSPSLPKATGAAGEAGASKSSVERATRVSAGNKVWTEEEYDQFVVRRFETYQGGRPSRARGVDSRLASVTRLHQKAAEMRTKMLMNNLGANDDFFDEDLKV